MWYSASYVSPVGRLLLASDGEALTGLWLEGQKYYGATLAGEVSEGCPAVLETAKAWLDDYFAGNNPAVSDLLLRPAGSSFRQMIFGILLEIPYGQTITYGEIAKRAAARMGRPSMSGQAVGGAVGHNPISIIIPCHRVVGTGGSLTGYAGGLDKKIWLLRHEGADMSGLFRPQKGTAL